MPHYADGTEAKVGDTVSCRPYNTKHDVTGVITSITPGVESCNCMVAFAARIPASHHQSQDAPDVVLVGIKQDYCETKACTKIC